MVRLVKANGFNVRKINRFKNMHQDYFYFNYPRESETEDLKKYRERVSEAVDETFSSA